MPSIPAGRDSGPVERRSKPSPSMSQAYINAVQTHLPHATLVFDRFHVVKLMNDMLSDLRRALQRQAEAEAKAVVKGTRWLLLKNLERLNAERDEGRRLQAGLALTPPWRPPTT